MSDGHSREEILAALRAEETAVVATHGGGGEIRTRKMHYVAADDFSIYLASMKADPKTVQIAYHPTVSLLVYNRGERLADSSEVEISGRAVQVGEESEREEAFAKLGEVSPVVKHLVEASNAEILEVIKVIPTLIKYRVFREITQGIPPTVFEFREREAEVGLGEPALLYRKLKIWWMELRPSFLIATLIPLLLGAVIAWANTGTLLWPYLLLTLLGGLLLHGGTNMINDYFDHKSRNDELNREFVRPFSGGSRMIQLGLLTPLEVLCASLLCFGLGSSIGAYLAWARGPLILALGLVGTVSGFFYTAPPFRFADRGVGELLVGLNFGVLMTLGSYFVQAQRLDWEPLLAALPVTFLIMAVLYINEFPDYEADKAVGKATLIVRLGRERAILGYIAIMSATYLALGLGALSGAVSPYAALGLLSLPLALKGVCYARAYYERPFELVPANASTIMAHLLTGALLVAGYILERLGPRGLPGLLPLGLATGLIIWWLHRHIEGQKRA
ncbi:MAG: 1,4-dihydroxy-2-naphthoate octaprenyltransferase, partial [Candidatus Bipolaricaulia bacterium]